mgnify:CR=1 FL=1
MKSVLSRPSLFAGVAIGILFIILVPLIVATFSAASFTASEMEEEIGRRHVVLSDALAREVTQFLESQAELLGSVVAILDAGLVDTGGNTQELLDAVVATTGAVEQILVADGDSRIIAAAPFDQDLMGMDISRVPVVAKALKSSSVEWSDMYVGPQDGIPAIGVAVPGTRYLIEAAVDLADLQALADRIEPGETGYAFVAVPGHTRDGHERIVGATEAIAAGSYEVELPTSRYHELDRLAAQVTDMASSIDRRETSLKEAVEEREVLLQEVHHRVKNNLSVLTSLLSLQQNELDSEEASRALGVARDRIFSISAVHQLLYRSQNYRAIHFAEFADELMRGLCGAANLLGGCAPADDAAGAGEEPSGGEEPSRRGRQTHGGITYTVRADDLSLDLTRAVPVALIVAELVTNAMRHGFKGRGGGTLILSLERNGSGENVLSVADDGNGLPDGFVLAEDGRAHPDAGSGGLGLTLVKSLVDQIGGTLQVAPRRPTGTVWHVRFKPSGPERSPATS